ncbi:MAG: hypothetical protein ACI8P3_003944 [Saprospiraceae bacterium]|jgi:hypothetical protein
MRKILLSTIFSFLTLAIAFAQFGVARDTVTISGAADEELFGEVVILNSADTSLDLRWVRTIETIPQDWDNYFCAVPGECGLPWTDSLSFVLPPATMTTGLLQCHCEPNGNPGVATVSVNFVSNITNEVLGNVVWICNASLVGTNELEAANIKLFPNPATDYFELENGDKVDRIIVYNILGKQVKYFGKEDDYLIGDLAKGLYLVQLIDLDTEATKTLKLKKN